MRIGKRKIRFKTKLYRNIFTLVMLSFLIAIAGIILYFIYDTPYTLTPSITITDDSLSSKTVQIQVNNKPLQFQLNYDKYTLYPQTLNTEFETTFTNLSVNQDIHIYINGEELKETLSLQLEHLSGEEYIHVEIKNDQDSRNYQIATLPQNLKDTVLTQPSPYEGDYYSNYINDNGESSIYKMNSEGEITYYYMNSYHGIGSLMNFQKHNINGQTRYSYFEPVADSDHMPSQGFNYGQIVIMNDHYQEIDHVRLLPSQTLSTTTLLSNHDFLYLDDNHYMITGTINTSTYYQRQKVYVKAAYVQEIQNHKVIHEWNSTLDSSLLTESIIDIDQIINSQSYLNYVHINSIDIDPQDGNWLISLKNQNTIMKVNKKSGKTIWKLGGHGDQFALSQEQLFSSPQYVKYLNDNTILLFENGIETMNSNIIQIQIDEKNHKIKDYQKFHVPGYYSSASGSVQKIDTNKNIFLVGWGYNNKPTIMTIYDFDKNETMTEIIGPRGNNTYRTLFYETPH